MLNFQGLVEIIKRARDIKPAQDVINHFLSYANRDK
jgi:hypothetical protein